MLNRLPCAHRRSRLFSIVIVALAFMLLGCYVQKASSTSAVEAAAMPVPPYKGAGHVIVQLFQVPGFIYPSINGVPKWTLYGNGLLIFKSDDSSELLQVYLSPNKIRSILDVILHKNNFFGSTHASYGRPLPDVGSLLLSVESNGHYKQVNLYGKPDISMDEETQHIFAIRDFLFAYHPATAQPYTPPGVALLVIPQEGDQISVPVWPYKDLSLARIAVRECPYLPFGHSGSCSPTKAGILALFGQRGQTLLQQMRANSYAIAKEQGKLYRLIVWPLLPDALYPRSNGELGINVQGVNSGIWSLTIQKP